jgi:2-haloacid dehalogenase
MTVSRREFLQTGAMVMAGANAGMSAQNSGGAPVQAMAAKALVFDTFGTVVDWRSSVAREVEALAKRKGVAVDGP